jgi:hypothetical protein
MFELVNLPEEEEFIRNALVGNIVRLSKVITLDLCLSLALGCLRNPCRLKSDDKF